MATNPDPAGGVYHGPYTDPNITTAKPDFLDVTNTPTVALDQEADTIPSKATPAAVGNSVASVYEPVDSEGVSEANYAPGDQGATKPDNAPVAWAIEDVAVNAGETRPYTDRNGAEGDSIASTQSFGRDPYRNDGMIGQDFFKNQG